LEHEDGSWEVYMHRDGAMQPNVREIQSNVFSIPQNSQEGMKVAFAHYF